MAIFEWDNEKAQANQKKHGASFETGRLAFDDPHRGIIRDLGHERGEKRFFCLGKVDNAILTVRFSYRRKCIKIYGASDGDKGENDMSKKIKYTDEPMKMGERMADFLPPPSKLVKREKTAKVTLELTEDSVDFFKRQAKRESVPYQRMLRKLIDIYAQHHEDA